MARTDAIVLGAGIVGVSAALHLAARGLAVALVDKRGPGEETSYGNTGIIEGNTLFAHAFPKGFAALLRIALKRSPEANYHLSELPQLAPWLLAYRANTRGARAMEFATAMRPLYARAVAEHEALMAEAAATRYLRKDGWLKLYRSDESFAGTKRERDYAAELGLTSRPLDSEQARLLEPSLAPVFRHAVHWPEAASVSNPLAVTRAYAAQFTKLDGVIVKGDAGTLHRSGQNWRVDTDEGPIDAKDAVVALGPWAPDLLGPLGIRLPMAFKRGYHRHFHSQRQRRADAADRRRRLRLLPGADGAGHPAYHRRGIRQPGRCADSSADRPRAARRARALSTRRRDRGAALDGIAAVLCRFTAGDRPGAGPARPLARLRPRALGSDTGAGQRPADCRVDDRRRPVLRSGAVFGRTFCLLNACVNRLSVNRIAFGD